MVIAYSEQIFIAFSDSYCFASQDHVSFETSILKGCCCWMRWLNIPIQGLWLHIQCCLVCIASSNSVITVTEICPGFCRGAFPLASLSCSLRSENYTDIRGCHKNSIRYLLWAFWAAPVEGDGVKSLVRPAWYEPKAATTPIEQEHLKFLWM